MQYRQHITRKLENLEAKLKHIEFHNGRGNREEVRNVQKEPDKTLSSNNNRLLPDTRIAF